MPLVAEAALPAADLQEAVPLAVLQEAMVPTSIG